MIKSSTVTEYINAAPKETQKKLREIRACIKKAAPKAEETISYGMPAFKLNGKPLVYFAGWRQHVSLYPMIGGIQETFKKEFAQYKTAKGTIQFPLDKPLPLTLIRKIVKFRVKDSLKKEGIG